MGDNFLTFRLAINNSNKDGHNHHVRPFILHYCGGVDKSAQSPCYCYVVQVVERSHRNDQERFYNHPHFYSLDDLNLQMRRYLTRSNDIPSKVLGWDSPKEWQKHYLMHFNRKKTKKSKAILWITSMRMPYN